MRRELSNRVAVLLARAALALAVATGCASQGEAQVETAPLVKHFGAAAAAFGQTIRVNVSSVDDPGQFPVGTACTIGVNILAADGSVLATSGTQQLPVGQTFFLDLNRNSLKGFTNRVLFRAVVGWVDDPNQIPDPCADIRATVEVYDNLTGRTQMFIGDPHI